MDMYTHAMYVLYACIFRSGSQSVLVKSRLDPFSIFDTGLLCPLEPRHRLRIDTGDVFPVFHFSVYTVCKVHRLGARLGLSPVRPASRHLGKVPPALLPLLLQHHLGRNGH